MRDSAFDLFRYSARSYAGDGVTPHRPVHTKAPHTCGACGHIIGFMTASDPVHAVPGECRCGAYLPPFLYRCGACMVEDDARAAMERLARMATYVASESVEDDGEAVEERDDDHGPKANPLTREAKAYLATYTGNFEFLLDMRRKVTGPKGVKFPLSPKQVEAILKCKRADEEREARRLAATAERVQTGRDLTALPYGRTYAAVENESGDITFLIFDRPAEKDRMGFASKWHGWVFVKQQVSDEEHKLGAQRPGETYSGQWPVLIDKVLADPVAAVARYGLELGVCGICGRALTNEESREKGIGPVCLAKLEGGL